MTEIGQHAHGHVHAYPGGYAVPAGMIAVPSGTAPAAGYVYTQDNGRFGNFLMRQYARSPRWMAPLAVLVCFFGGVAYTLVTDPVATSAFGSPTCIIKLTTGFDCPGCGGTRAFWYLLHGDLAAAARCHLMAVFAAPFLAYMFVAWAARQAFGVRLPYLRITPKAVSIFLAAWAVFTVARNLPWPPFTWMYV